MISARRHSVVDAEPVCVTFDVKTMIGVSLCTSQVQVQTTIGSFFKSKEVRNNFSIVIVVFIMIISVD